VEGKRSHQKDANKTKIDLKKGNQKRHENQRGSQAEDELKF
jgi:hypothetical protein